MKIDLKRVRRVTRHLLSLSYKLINQNEEMKMKIKSYNKEREIVNEWRVVCVCCANKIKIQFDWWQINK